MPSSSWSAGHPASVPATSGQPSAASSVPSRSQLGQPLCAPARAGQGSSVSQTSSPSPLVHWKVSDTDVGPPGECASRSSFGGPVQPGSPPVARPAAEPERLDVDRAVGLDHEARQRLLGVPSHAVAILVEHRRELRRVEWCARCVPDHEDRVVAGRGHVYAQRSADRRLEAHPAAAASPVGRRRSTPGLVREDAVRRALTSRSLADVVNAVLS